MLRFEVVARRYLGVNTPAMIDAVLFDMDGVLVDSEPAHFAVTRAALGVAGLPIPTDDEWDAVFFGRPDREGLADWCLRHHLTTDIGAIMADKLLRFEERFEELVTPFEDAQWLARALHAAGVPLAIVTGARRVEMELVVRHFGLTGVFQATISSDDIYAGKPDPEGFLKGAAALDVAPERCAVIEDALPGIRAAQAAGMALVVVDRLGRSERFAPIVPVARLDQVVLDGLLAGRDSSRP